MQPFEDAIKKRTTLRPGDYDEHLPFPGIEEDFSTHYLRDEKIRFIRQVTCDKTHGKSLLIIRREDLVTVSEPQLLKIERLLLGQLEHAQSARYDIHKVVVVGGFAQSLAVQDRIRKVIHDFNNNKLDDLGEIRIIWPHTASGLR